MNSVFCLLRCEIVVLRSSAKVTLNGSENVSLATLAPYFDDVSHLVNAVLFFEMAYVDISLLNLVHDVREN